MVVHCPHKSRIIISLFQYNIRYIKLYHPDITWHHEENSIAMFDYLLEQNENVRQKFQQYNLDDSHIQMIKRIIKGVDPETEEIPEVVTYHGETYYKWFLYEIVANKRTGIDCDKFDYFARDSHQVGVKNSFNHMRYFQNIRILGVNGQLQVNISRNT